jgi:purine-cytosine permease-like protein
MAASSSSDDFAMTPVPDSARSSSSAIFFAAAGIATSLFNMQIFSFITITYGTSVAFCSIAYASVVSVVLGLILTSNAIRTGFGVGLFARRLLGYRGASLLSLSFGVASLIFFAAETNIMAASLEGLVGTLPKWILLPAVSAAMVPLVWFGMKVLARVQLFTFLLYAALLAWALYSSFRVAGPPHWTSYLPEHAPAFAIGLPAALGISSGSIFITVLVTADYARYVQRDQREAGRWSVGAGIQLFTFGIQGLLGVWFASRYLDANPGHYFVTVLGAWGIVLAIATQIRINAANMYSGSLAFVNMFTQALNLNVSRHAVIVGYALAVGIGLTLDLIKYIMPAMTVIGNIMLCFTALLITDLYIARPIRTSNESVLPYEKGDLPDWRWRAIVPMILAVAFGGLMMTGILGNAVVSWASLLACVLQISIYLGTNMIMRPEKFPTE